MASSGSRFWLLYPLILLCLCVTAAFIIHPHWSTAVLGLLIMITGAGRSFLRSEHWTLADNITTTRLGLIIVFCALAAQEPGFSWPAVVLGAVALALDGVDGFAARRTKSTTAGAAYDEAVDALFVLILGLALVPLWGLWTILPGMLFYIFRAIGLFRAAWRRPLPPSTLRKTIAAAQGILLLTAGSPLAQAYPWLGPVSVGVALVALAFSFGRDLSWLEHQAHAAAG